MKKGLFALLLALFASACMSGVHDGQVVNPDARLRFSGYLERPGEQVQLLVLDARGTWVRVPTSAIFSQPRATPWGDVNWYAWTVDVQPSTLRAYWRNEGIAGRRLHVKAQARRSASTAWYDLYSFSESILALDSRCSVFSTSSVRALEPCLSTVSPIARLQDPAFRGCATSDTTCDGRDDDCNGLVDDMCSEPPGSRVLVPRSDTCNQGVGPLDCATVPPRTESSFGVDGTQSPGEYWGAVELPLPSRMAQNGRGHVFATVDARRNLLLYFDDVMLPLPPTSSPAPPAATKIQVVLDFDRWASDPAILRDTDRAYAATVELGDTSIARPVTRAGVTRWEAVATSTAPGFQAATGGCVPVDGMRSCDLEMVIPLPASAFVPPASGLLPGVGIAIVDAFGQATLPEELSVGSTALATAMLDRTKQVSLVFGRPEGVPFTFMSWNIARWGEGIENEIAGKKFDHVPLSEHANVIWEYDIVALQEVWDREDARELLNLVNERRLAARLEPLRLIGPAAPPPSFFQANGGGLRGDYQAGIFILTKFPVIGQDHIIYSDCLGEDCLKPKGAQWARLSLRPPDARDLSEECAPARRDTSLPPGCGATDCFLPPVPPGEVVRRPASCPLAPTTEMYVDVFNTHLQAREPQICAMSDAELAAVWAGLLAECGRVPRPVICTALVSALSAVTAYCGARTSEEVTDKQLQKLGEFIERVVGERRDQPALIGGDFNIDGRQLLGSSGEVKEPMYEWMLDHLGILRPDSASLLDDTIVPRANVFPWTIDHGDLAREEEQYDWSACGHGTSVGNKNEPRDWLADGSERADGCAVWSCDRTDDKRLDYIFVRPPAPPSVSDDPPGYMLTRSDGPAWEPLWPSTMSFEEHLCATADGSYEAPWGDAGRAWTGRISDHRPIVGRFELTPLRVPGRFQHGVDHTLDIRVVSMDAKGTQDCWRNLCAPLDPYVIIEGFAYEPGSSTAVPAPGVVRRATCSGWSLSTADGPCIDDWGLIQDAPAGGFAKHEVLFQLWDEDFGRGARDDHLVTVEPGTDPRFIIDWRAGNWDVRVDRSNTPPDGWSGPMPFFSSDPVCHETRATPPSLVVCMATERTPD